MEKSHPPIEPGHPADFPDRLALLGWHAMPKQVDPQIKAFLLDQRIDARGLYDCLKRDGALAHMAAIQKKFPKIVPDFSFDREAREILEVPQGVFTAIRFDIPVAEFAKFAAEHPAVMHGIKTLRFHPDSMNGQEVDLFFKCRQQLTNLDRLEIEFRAADDPEPQRRAAFKQFITCVSADPATSGLWMTTWRSEMFGHDAQVLHAFEQMLRRVRLLALEIHALDLAQLLPKLRKLPLLKMLSLEVAWHGVDNEFLQQWQTQWVSNVGMLRRENPALGIVCMDRPPGPYQVSVQDALAAMFGNTHVYILRTQGGGRPFVARCAGDLVLQGCLQRADRVTVPDHEELLQWASSKLARQIFAQSKFVDLQPLLEGFIIDLGHEHLPTRGAIQQIHKRTDGDQRIPGAPVVASSEYHDLAQVLSIATLQCIQSNHLQVGTIIANGLESLHLALMPDFGQDHEIALDDHQQIFACLSHALLTLLPLPPGEPPAPPPATTGPHVALVLDWLGHNFHNHVDAADAIIAPPDGATALFGTLAGIVNEFLQGAQAYMAAQHPQQDLHLMCETLWLLICRRTILPLLEDTYRLVMRIGGPLIVANVASHQAPR